MVRSPVVVVLLIERRPLLGKLCGVLDLGKKVGGEFAAGWFGMSLVQTGWSVALAVFPSIQTG